MEILTTHPSDYLKLLCKTHNKWGMTVYSAGLLDEEYEKYNYAEELRKAVPWMTEDQVFDLILDECLIVLFDSKEEMYDAFDQSKGRKGARCNDYDGPADVVVVSCDNEGNLLGENV